MRMTRLGLMLSSLGAAVRNENVRRVELAWGAAITAEWAHFVALGVFAYEQGGAAAVGVAGLVRLLPAALLAPFAASLGDRFRRERFLLAVAVVGSGALAASAAASFAGEEVLVFGFAMFVGISATLVRPALQALLPSLARRPEELIASNGATSTVESLGTLVGPLLAGVLISVANVGVVFIVGAAMLLAAAAMFGRVKVEGRDSLALVGETETVRRMIGAGFQTIARAPRPRLLVGLTVAQAFVRGCLNVLIVVAVFQVFDRGAAEVGYLTAAMGVGGLVGAAGATTLGARRLAVVFGIALVFWGLPIMLMAPGNYFGAAIVRWGSSAQRTASKTSRCSPCSSGHPERQWSPGSSASCGPRHGRLRDRVDCSAGGCRNRRASGGTRSRRAGSAALDACAVPAARRDRSRSRPRTELELIDRVPMFAPLSIALKERVAASLAPVSVTAGESVLRAGDVGDRLWIVGGGELDIRLVGCT